jgi:hypothetical protein
MQTGAGSARDNDPGASKTACRTRMKKDDPWSTVDRRVFEFLPVEKDPRMSLEKKTANHFLHQLFKEHRIKLLKCRIH